VVPVSEYETMLINELQTIEDLYWRACVSCRSEWYCPNYCEWLEKATRMPFEKIQKCYVRNEGDIREVYRYVKNYKEKRSGEK